MIESPIRRTKIVATLGPSTGTAEGVRRLLEAGVNVFRVNSSHGTPEVRREWVRMVRATAESARQPVAVLLDLQGPRIRVGALREPRTLTAGQTVVFAPEESAAKAEI
ncbi:MAG: pyruvate kinase, partial [Gemmatimonadales bacterium]